MFFWHHAEKKRHAELISFFDFNCSWFKRLYVWLNRWSATFGVRFGQVDLRLCQKGILSALRLHLPTGESRCSTEGSELLLRFDCCTWKRFRINYEVVENIFDKTHMQWCRMQVVSVVASAPDFAASWCAHSACQASLAGVWSAPSDHQCVCSEPPASADKK